MDNFKSDKFILILIIVTLLSSVPIMLFQAALFHRVYVDTRILKMAVAVMLSVVIVNKIVHGKQYLKANNVVLILFIIFILLNFVTIMYFTPSSDNAVGAFLYNYSLLLIILPWYYLLEIDSEKRNYKLLYYVTIGYFMFIDSHGIIQYIIGSHLMVPGDKTKYLYIYSLSYLMPSDSFSVIVKHDYMKFDQIGHLIRAVSLLKSPLEFGLVNSIFSCYLLSKIIRDNRRYMYIVPLYFLSLSSVFVTLSRTAIMICLFANLFTIMSVIYIHFRKADHKVKIQLVRKIITTFLVGVILLILLLSGVSHHTVFDPTNYYLRLNIWRNLLAKFDGIQTWLFGFGIVQNGSYGNYHSVPIDNTFLGILMTGGLVSLALFLAIFVLTIRHSLSDPQLIDDSNKPLRISFTAFFIAFLIGGLTENMMHLMYYPIIALAISKLVQHTEKQSINQNASLS